MIYEYMNGCNEQTLIIHYVGRNYDYYICRTLRNAQCHNPLGRIHTYGNRDSVRNFGQVMGVTKDGGCMGKGRGAQK